jgi:hypothetical protein
MTVAFPAGRKFGYLFLALLAMGLAASIEVRDSPKIILISRFLQQSG